MFFSLLCAGGIHSAATAETMPDVKVSADVQMQGVASDVQYQHIGHWDQQALNQILTISFPKFSGVGVRYSPALNGVHLYRVSYQSVIPERGNRSVTTAGLVAVPDNIQPGQATKLPILSYQHGTVYGKNEVPSIPKDSPETQLMLAQFAGQGYVVVGADYFGMGTSSEPEGYMVKASHQQATFDMLRASRAVLSHLQVPTGPLFLGGWSQGGFVTMSLLERLEQEGIAVAGTATASAPIALYPMLQGFLQYPRSIDAKWINSVVILSAFAFENYYNVPGLAKSVFQEGVYEVARKAYLREDFNINGLPADLRKLIRPEYFDIKYFAESPYGKLLDEAQVYRWIYQSPVRNYYGEADEAIPVGVGKLAMTYQQAMGDGNPYVTAISTGATNHRSTYAVAAPYWKAWFDSLRTEALTK